MFAEVAGGEVGRQRVALMAETEKRAVSVSAAGRKVMQELQDVLTRNRAALFFTDEYVAELWIEGHCHVHITQDEHCALIVESVCTATSIPTTGG